MPTQSATVEVEDIELEVLFDYYEGHPQTRDDPPEPERLEVHGIFHGGEDIYYLLDQKVIEKIEGKIKDKKRKKLAELRQSRRDPRWAEVA
jgi:hypothetical protein